MTTTLGRPGHTPKEHDMNTTPDWTHADLPRRREAVTIEQVTDSTITYDGGWTFAPPAEHMPRFRAGQRIVVETVLATQVTGMALVDGRDQPTEWLWLKTSEQLDRERDEWLAESDRKRRERVDANRADWERREAALPSPLRRRLERFRANAAAAQFDASGWGYELVVCELAVLYAASAGEDSPDVNAFASEHGTSGNQHGYARALSQLIGDEEREDDIANSVSALAPLTGDADYSGSRR